MSFRPYLRPSSAGLLLALLFVGCDSAGDAPLAPDTNTDAAMAVTNRPNASPESWESPGEFDLDELIARSQVQIGTLTPSQLNATLAPGETVTEDKLASLPAQADVVDIMFAFDNTGSMGGELDNLKVNAVDIMTSLASLISDVQFGLVSFADYEGSFDNTAAAVGCDYLDQYGFTGDSPYVIEQTLNPDITTVGTAIGALALSAGGGADLPESYSRALYELAQELLGNTGPDGAVNWRPEARRIVILFGDAFPHDCDLFDPVEGDLGVEITGDDFGTDPGRDAAVGTADDLAILDVLADLAATDITLISLHSVQTSIPGLPEEPSLALWTFYAEQTGGTNFEINTDGSFPEGTDIVATILDLVGEQISTVDDLILTVCPGDEAFAPWISSVTPPSYSDITLPADRDFELILGPPPGTDPGTYEFDMCAIGDGAVLGRQDVTIEVPGISEPEADVSVEKTADPTDVLVGEDITWTITVENAGPDEATNVVVTDVLPAGVSLVSASASCSEAGGTATCEVGDIASGGSVVIEVVTTADAAGTIMNTADVESDVADPNGENNSSTAEANASDPGEPEADVSVEKTADPTDVLVGEDITWTITVENAGPDEATNVVVTDVLPAGVSLVSASASCSEAGGTATCEVGDIASGGSVVIEVVTTADAAGTIMNTADVESDVADPNGENNSSTAEANASDPPSDQCVVIDFESSGSHLSPVSSFMLGTSTIDITVEPGGTFSQAAAAIYDSDTSAGPDPDLEWDGGICAGCAGQGNLLIIPDVDPATFGDSQDGGVIVLTGFGAGEYSFRSLFVADSDETPFVISVDSGDVGASTPGANGGVESILLDANSIAAEVRIDLGTDSGAVDDLEFCPAGTP